MAWGYFNDARYEDTLRMSSFFNKKWYRYADVHFLRGTSHFKLGNCAQAMMDLETAAQQKESHRYRMYAMEYLADCYRSNKDYDRAIQLYEEIGAQYPTGSGHTEVPLKLPETKEEKLEYIKLHQDEIVANLQSEIIRNYKYVVDIYPHSQMAIEALYRLGLFYQRELQDPEKAKESYLKALELSRYATMPTT
jgi:tetratricopeptide (TPR) repeat protein